MIRLCVKSLNEMCVMNKNLLYDASSEQSLYIIISTSCSECNLICVGMCCLHFKLSFYLTLLLCVCVCVCACVCVCVCVCEG